MKRKALSMILTALMILSLTDCKSSGPDTDATITTPEAEITQTPMQETEQENTPTPVQELESKDAPTQETEPESEEDVDLSLDDLVVLIKAAFSKGEKNYDVCAENNAITGSVWTEGLSYALSLEIESGTLEHSVHWAETKDSMMILNNSMRELLDAAGYGDTSAILQVLDDTNLDRAFLVITNGEITYDIAHDEKALQMLTPDTSEPKPEESANLSPDDLVAIVKFSIASEDYNYDVNLENDGMIVSIWMEGLNNALSDESRRDAGKNIFIGINDDLCKIVENWGYGDISVTLQVLDDTNLKEKLLVITNGEITYEKHN